METTEIRAGSIVVGVDGSSSAAHALDWAIDQAGLERRPLTLAHGVGPGQTLWVGQAGLDHSLVLNGMREDGQAILDSAAEHVAARNPAVEVHQVLRLADPRETLLGLAREAAMVVLGSRGRGPVRSLLLGSVSVAVSRHAPCPVVVLRPHHGGETRRGVLVGVDGTASSVATLEFAFRAAAQRGLPLTVMHSFWDLGNLTAGPAMVLAGELGVEAAFEAGRLVLAESVSGLAEKFPDVHVTTELATGMAADCLVRAAGRMDLVVVGRHLHSPVSGLVRGSVAAAVVEHASSVVAVVPEETHPEETHPEENHPEENHPDVDHT